ncbi:MAG: FkbM family methyltransferase [Symplocastrum torsivum CPER-KK1]|jgi:FkbM family methyltransferase|uniref:FkbM family methyltransferase n=1 Tax=Symplocastrum torsivum CPER-KK1 TaxID=450513 RepID=A0A951U9L4_9CYAN|nr:FkbM family methyltransferase [Symplocastrum torsivum CPER-KK1]
MNQFNKISGLIAIRGHHFYANLINSDSIVLDLGAHLGQFSSEVSDIFGCCCYAVEALPSLYNKIVETSLVKKFNYAISITDELVEFCITDNPEFNHINKGSTYSVKETIKIEGLSIESFMKRNTLQSVDLLKVDIEGAEIDLFKSMSDTTLCKIKQITIEFHDFVFNSNREVEAIINRLKLLGFACVIFSRSNNGDVLFINLKQCQLPFFDYIYIQFLARYFRGLSRIITRLLSKETLTQGKE